MNRPVTSALIATILSSVLLAIRAEAATNPSPSPLQTANQIPTILPADPAVRPSAKPAAAQPSPAERLCASKRRAVELIQADPYFKENPRENRLLAWGKTLPHIRVLM